MQAADLTTTSYAILGLLAIKPWTTYELAQQMERSLRRYWPRAASRVYEEPKRLAAVGMARAERELVGKRPRTVYSITPEGRRALQSWLAQPGSGPSIEFEALLKIFYAEHARRDDVRVQIEAIRAWARARTDENIGFARSYLDDGGPFPDRLAVIALTGVFYTELVDAVERWAAWADEVVAGWPEHPADAEPDRDRLREIALRRRSTDGP